MINQTSCQKWQSCPRGTYVSVSGTVFHDQVCGACTGETFSNATNQPVCHPYVDCLPPYMFVSKPGTNRTNRLCGQCPYYQHTSMRNEAFCRNGPAILEDNSLLLQICLVIASISLLLHLGRMWSQKRSSSSTVHALKQAQRRANRTTLKPSQILPKPIVSHDEAKAPRDIQKIRPEHAIAEVHKSMLRDFRRAAKTARGRVYRRFVAARAIPHLIEIKDIDHLLIAVEHAQGADGVDMLPLSLQKFVGMGLAYIEGAREKANQDVANAVKNEPARPMQYERLDKALKQALKFNVHLQGLSPESKQQQENVKDMLLTASQLRDRLEKLWAMRKLVEKMDQRSVAEIRSFNNPKPQIQGVMRATLILLGTKERSLKTWNDICKCIVNVGENSLRFRIQNFIVQDVTQKQAARAESLLHGIEVDRIASISAGATVFYRWSTAVCLWMMSEANQEDSITRRASMAASKVTYDAVKDGWEGDGGAMPKISPTHTPSAKGHKLLGDMMTKVVPVNHESEQNDQEPLTTPGKVEASPRPLVVPPPQQRKVSMGRKVVRAQRKLLVSKPALSETRPDYI